MHIIISNHVADKVISISGFATQNSVNSQKVAEAIEQLTTTDFSSLSSNTILSSSITIEQVYKKLLQVPIIDALTDDLKALISPNDIELVYLDSSLEIIISNHIAAKSIVVGGFLSQNSHDAQVVEKAIHSLAANDFKALANSNINSSDVTLDQVYQKLIASNAVKDLSVSQK